jgi:hypothetical protein
MRADFTHYGPLNCEKGQSGRIHVGVNVSTFAKIHIAR